MFGLFGGSQRDIYGDQAGLSGGFGGGRGGGDISNTLLMAGLGLMSSPRNNPMEGVMKGVTAGLALDERGKDKSAYKRALYMSYRASGMDHQRAAMLAEAGDPAIGKLLLDQQDKATSLKVWQKANEEDSTSLPEGGGSAPRLGPRSESPAGAPSMAGGGSSRSMSMPGTADPVAADLEPHQRALLNAIALGESGGKYDVRYTPKGGASFDLATGRHPGIFEPGPHGQSSAAGRYQFTKTTWDRVTGGNVPFTPENQDRMALKLAAQDYNARTGRDLDADLQNGGFTPQIARTLAPTWAAFKGNPSRYVAAYQQSLAKYGAPRQVASADSSFVPQTEDEIAPVLGAAPSSDPVAETKARTGVDWNNPVARQHMIDAGLTPPGAAAPATEQPAPSPQASLDPETQKIKAQYDAQIKELLGTGQMKKAEQLEAMRDASMAQRMQSMPSQQVASADNSVPGASPALRPSYVGTPPGYDWRTATDPGQTAPQPAQQTANVPLPPERPPETYTPRAPLQPAAAPSPIASIDPNSSNAGAIQFASAGMGRGGLPQPANSRQTAQIPANPSQTAPAVASAPAGTQVAQAPSQTATDAAPTAQAQVVVQQAERVAQAGANIPDPAQARSAGNQSTLAQEHYKQFLRLNKWASHPYMPKPAADAYAKRAEFHKDMAKEYLKPSEAQKLAAAAGLVEGTPEYQRAMAGAISGNADTPDQKNARFAHPNDLAAQQGAVRDQLSKDTPAYRNAKRKLEAMGLREGTPEFNKQLPETLEKFASAEGGQPKVESAYDQRMGGIFADMNKELITEAREAKGKIATLNRLEQLLSDPNVYQGTAGPLVLQAKRLAKSLGFDVEGVEGAEAITAIANRFALEARNPSGGAGMPGALSDKDREFLVDMGPGLGRTPEGNKHIIDYNRRLAMRSLDVERQRQLYLSKNKGRLDEGFYTHLEEWSAKNPVFNDEDRKNVQRLSGGSTPKDSKPAPAEETPPPGYTGSRWKYLTPEERKLWQ
jgi:muramidase (phage lysozyme)